MTTLFDAIESADAGTVWQLCQSGADLGAIDESTGMTALAQAAEAGQSEIVRTLLDAGAAPDLGGVTTPLEAAVVEGHIEAAKTLIDAGADVNRAVEDGFTPLMTASATGDLLIVEVLLAAGARPRKTNDEGQTAISLAKEAGHDTIVGLLRKSRRRKRPAAESEAVESKPSETEATETETSETSETSETEATETAATETEATVTETHAEDGETPSKSSDGTADSPKEIDGDQPATDQPASEQAASNEQDPAKDAPDSKTAPQSTANEPPPRQRARRQRGADGDAPSSKTSDRQAADRRPSQTSAAGRVEAEEPKVAAVADLEAQVEAMVELLSKGKGEKITKHFENFEAGMEARDEEGRTALMIAAKTGHVELVSWLVDQGADFEAIDRPRVGHTVLVHATQSMASDREKIIRRLVEAGADINRPCGQRRRTPLMHAVQADVYLDRVEGPVFGSSTKALLKLKPRLEAKDARGNTVWQLTKKDAIGAPTYGASRRRLHQMLRVLEHGGAQPIPSSSF